MFCALLGTMAGNLVLTLGALGGAYIGGGIAPGLGPMFTSSRFRDRFEDKGRFTGLRLARADVRNTRRAARAARPGQRVHRPRTAASKPTDQHR